MTIVMNMSSYAVEEMPPAGARCDTREMRTSWNPQLELATQQQLVALKDCYPGLPASLVNADAETFLQKMYAYQR